MKEQDDAMQHSRRCAAIEDHYRLAVELKSYLLIMALRRLADDLNKRRAPRWSDPGIEHVLRGGLPDEIKSTIQRFGGIAVVPVSMLGGKWIAHEVLDATGTPIAIFPIAIDYEASKTQASIVASRNRACAFALAEASRPEGA